MEIDDHIGCAMSGLIADARTLVEHARVETQVQAVLILCPPFYFKLIAPHFNYYAGYGLQNHRFSYGEPMTVESTTQALCDLALRFGEGDEESMVIHFCQWPCIFFFLHFLQNIREKTHLLSFACEYQFRYGWYLLCPLNSLFVLLFLKITCGCSALLWSFSRLLNACCFICFFFPLAGNDPGVSPFPCYVERKECKRSVFFLG